LLLSAGACCTALKGKGSPYSITECRVSELIPVLGSQPAGDVSHKPGGRLPLFSARPAVTSATLKRAAVSIDISCPQGAQQQTRRMPLLLSNDKTDGRSTVT